MDHKTPLHAACDQDSVSVVDLLLSRSASVNAEDDYKKLPLHYAVAKKHIAVIKHLLEAGADVNHQDDEGKSPLDIAQGDASLFDLLDQYNPFSLDRVDSAGNTALINSIQREAEALSLIERGANVRKAGKDDKSPLHWASEKGLARVVQALLSKGALIGVPDSRRKRPLHYAAFENQSAIVALPIAAGGDGDVDVKDASGQTPLHAAADQGSFASVKVLLSHGSSVDEVDQAGNTALDLALLHNHDEVINLLLEMKDRSGLTPLYRAVQAKLEGKGKLVRVEKLLTKGAFVDPQDGEGQTPLYKAIASNDTETTALLVRYGASLAIQAKNGKTPLDIAQESVINKEIKKIIARSSGSTILIIAVKSGNLEEVRSLIRDGADVDVFDNDGKALCIGPPY